MKVEIPKDFNNIDINWQKKKKKRGKKLIHWSIQLAQNLKACYYIKPERNTEE